MEKRTDTLLTLSETLSEEEFVALCDEDIKAEFVSEVVTGFWLRPDWLWQDPLPAVLEIAGEMGIV